MLFINFDNVPKGTKISGGLTSIRIVATLSKLKLLSFINSGYKPLKYEPNPKLHGWFVILLVYHIYCMLGMKNIYFPN